MKYLLGAVAKQSSIAQAEFISDVPKSKRELDLQALDVGDVRIFDSTGAKFISDVPVGKRKLGKTPDFIASQLKSAKTLGFRL